MKKKIFIISIIGFFLDRISKILIMKNLVLYKKNIIIDNFFNITYVKNNGAAWSILSGNRIFLILISIFALLFIIYSIKKTDTIKSLDGISYGLLIGGILGNFIDRIVYGYVIDFIDIIIFNYNFPVFNIADSLIVIGVIIMTISVFRGDKVESNN